MAGIFDLTPEDWRVLLAIVGQHYYQFPSSQTDREYESRRDRILQVLIKQAYPND